MILQEGRDMSFGIIVTQHEKQNMEMGGGLLSPKKQPAPTMSRGRF